MTLDRCDTIVDGLRVKRVGAHTFELVRRFVDEIVTVPDDVIFANVVWVMERCKLVAEGAAAATVAALRSGSWSAGGNEGRLRAVRREPRSRPAPRASLELAGRVLQCRIEPRGRNDHVGLVPDPRAVGTGLDRRSADPQDPCPRLRGIPDACRLRQRRDSQG